MVAVALSNMKELDYFSIYASRSGNLLSSIILKAPTSDLATSI